MYIMNDFIEKLRGLSNECRNMYDLCLKLGIEKIGGNTYREIEKIANENGIILTFEKKLKRGEWTQYKLEEILTKDSPYTNSTSLKKRLINEGLKEIDKNFEQIDGAIFTHNHSDHVNNLKCLSPKKMYALEGTLPPLCHVINLHESFNIGDFKITAFKTSHDAINPCGYIIEADDEKLVYMTDTGILVEEELPLIKNPDYLIIESNHDIKMEMLTNRTMELKQRVLSDHGHLCNEDSAFASSNIIGEKTKQIILAHLSEEANTPECALSAYQKVFAFKGLDASKYKIVCAKQWESTKGGNYEN